MDPQKVQGPRMLTTKRPFVRTVEPPVTDQPKCQG